MHANARGYPEVERSVGPCDLLRACRVQYTCRGRPEERSKKVHWRALCATGLLVGQPRSIKVYFNGVVVGEYFPALPLERAL